MALATAWRILLADDHLVVRAGLKALLSADPRCGVVGEASSIDELLTAVHNLRPDLVVLDLSFGADNALEALPALLGSTSAPRIIVLTMHDDVAFAREAFARGAHGYLVKEAAADELARAVETVMAGATYLHPELGARLARSQAGPAERLSAREREVLVRLARGHTNAEVANQLLVSLRTVEAYRASLRTRLGISTRAEMVEAAHRLGLLP
jgi:two-component system response regulator NreC